MLTDISCAAHLAYTGKGLVLWYIAITLPHYYSDIKNFLNEKRTTQLDSINRNKDFTAPSAVDPQHTDLDDEPDSASQQDFEMIEDLVSRVKTAASNASENKNCKSIKNARHRKRQ